MELRYSWRIVGFGKNFLQTIRSLVCLDWKNTKKTCTNGHCRRVCSLCSAGQGGLVLQSNLSGSLFPQQLSTGEGKYLEFGSPLFLLPGASQYNETHSPTSESKGKCLSKLFLSHCAGRFQWLSHYFCTFRLVSTSNQRSPLKGSLMSTISRHHRL